MTISEYIQIAMLVISFFMAFITLLLVIETIKMRRAQTEPEIQITLESYESAVNIIRLNITNVGLGAAKNIKFSPVVLSGGENGQILLKEFTKTAFFETGLSFLGSSKNIYSNYTNMTSDFSSKVSTLLLFNVSFENRNGKIYKDSIRIDMSELVGVKQIGELNLYSIAKALKNIDKNINHITTGFKKLKVDTYNQTDRDRIRKEELEQLEQFEKQFEENL